jgi:hypothetical protein
VDHYKGVYQFINQDFARFLPERFALVNREQDLGDEGLRQAKMTYRPSGFVKKYRVTREAPAPIAGPAVSAEGGGPEAE